MNHVECCDTVDPHERLVGLLPPFRAREVVGRSVDVVKTSAVDLLLAAAPPDAGP